MSTLVESKLTQNTESSLNFRWVTEPPIIQLNSDEIASRVERLKTNLDGWGLVSVDNLGPSDRDVRDWQNPQRTQQARWNQRISSTEIMVDKDKWDKEHSTFEYRVNSEPIGIIAITKKRGGFVVPHLVTHPGSSEAGGILIEHAAQWSDTHGGGGYTNLQNTADYSGSTVGVSISGSSPYGGSSASLTGGPQLSQKGDSANGTTYAAVSPGAITVRGDAGTGQDSTAGLSRDTANANGSVQNTFNAQDVSNSMAIQQAFGQLATFAVGQAADRLEQSNPLFAEGGVGRDTLHAAVAAISAAISGGNIAGAVGGSIAGDALQALARPIIEQAVSQLPASAQDAARNALNDIVATAGGALGGALAGGGSQGSTAGAGSAANNEVYNFQLDPNDPEARLTGESKSSNPFSRPW